MQAEDGLIAARLKKFKLAARIAIEHALSGNPNDITGVKEAVIGFLRIAKPR